MPFLDGIRARSVMFVDRRRSIEQTRPRPNPPGVERARGALVKVSAHRCERRGPAKGDQKHSMTEYHNYYKRYALMGRFVMQPLTLMASRRKYARE